MQKLESLNALQSLISESMEIFKLEEDFGIF